MRLEVRRCQTEGWAAAEGITPAAGNEREGEVGTTSRGGDDGTVGVGCWKHPLETQHVFRILHYSECLLFQPFCDPRFKIDMFGSPGDSARHAGRERERGGDQKAEKGTEEKTSFAIMLSMLAYVCMLLLMCIFKSFNQC